MPEVSQEVTAPSPATSDPRWITVLLLAVIGALALGALKLALDYLLERERLERVRAVQATSVAMSVSGTGQVGLIALEQFVTALQKSAKGEKINRDEVIDFLDNLAERGLVSTEDWKEIKAELKNASALITAEFAKELIHRFFKEPTQQGPLGYPGQSIQINMSCGNTTQPTRPAKKVTKCEEQKPAK